MVASSENAKKSCNQQVIPVGELSPDLRMNTPQGPNDLPPGPQASLEYNRGSCVEVWSQVLPHLE